MDALAIPIREELQRLENPVPHGVVPVFMGVDVLSKIEEEMFGELNRLACNHGSRAKRNRYVVLSRESVDPKRHGIYKLTHEETWDAAV